MTMTLTTPDHTGTPISALAAHEPSRPSEPPSEPPFATASAASTATSDRAVAPGALVRTADAVAVGGVVFAGAIFGFFYAWICSTMWGLDNADPRVAIEAMQEMNASVRNGVFFPAFFLTPVVLALGALLFHRTGRTMSARRLGAGAAVYLVGGLLLTMIVLVPMNEEFADVVIPADRAAAEAIWTDYSGEWQIWNIVRTVFCGIALTLAAIGLRGRRP